MKRVLATIVGALLISTFVYASDPDEDQIRARAQEFADAWNKHDAMGMAYLWSASGDLVNPFGRSATGLAAIQNLIADEHSKLMKNSTYSVTNLKVRFLNPTTAVVDQDIAISGVMTPDGSTMDMKPHIMSVMTKSGGKWWISSARAYSLMQTPPPAAAK